MQFQNIPIQGTKLISFCKHLYGYNLTTNLWLKCYQTLVWKNYIDHIITLDLLRTDREVFNHFIEKANKHRPTIEFAAEITVSEANFLDTTICMGERFLKIFKSFPPINSCVKTGSQFSIPTQYPQFSKSTSNQQRHSSTRSTLHITQQEQRNTLIC